MSPRYEVYKDEAGEFRWRLVAGNGEIVASGESYIGPYDAAGAAKTAARVSAEAAGLDIASQSLAASVPVAAVEG